MNKIKTNNKTTSERNMLSDSTKYAKNQNMLKEKNISKSLDKTVKTSI